MTVTGDKDWADRREHPRFEAPDFTIDYAHGESFLFAYIDNIGEMGIFIRSDDPHPVGTHLLLRFAPGSYARLELEGEVVWVNSVRCDGSHINPGMGVRFLALTPDQRETVVEMVRTVAYLQSDGEN
jgi:type IV pilus assembly protein PilZ